MSIGLGGRYFPRIQRPTQGFRDLYRGPAAVEREFGRSKHDYGSLRFVSVALSAFQTMLARLSLALTRVRGVVLAAG